MKGGLFLISLLIVAAAVSAKTYTLKQDGITFSADLYSDGAKIAFEVPYNTVDKSFVFHLKTDKGDCPGYAYWFSKDNLGLPALTLSSGCTSGEPAIKIRFELGTDFGKREKDLVDNGVYKFAGQLYYDESIDKFDISKYNRLRIIRTNSQGSRIDQTYNL